MNERRNRVAAEQRRKQADKRQKRVEAQNHRPESRSKARKGKGAVRVPPTADCRS